MSEDRFSRWLLGPKPTIPDNNKGCLYGFLLFVPLVFASFAVGIFVGAAVVVFGGHAVGLDTRQWSDSTKVLAAVVFGGFPGWLVGMRVTTWLACRIFHAENSPRGFPVEPIPPKGPDAEV